MKILHLISQHPESTGSGFYLQNIIRQAAAAGHDNFLIAGMSGSRTPRFDHLDRKFCRFVDFAEGSEIDFIIPGMSDVMPYPSSRFKDLTATQLDRYEHVFRKTIDSAIKAFSPDIIHSHHLWLMTAVARSINGKLPMVTSCHSTDLRQFAQCPHLRSRVLPACRQIDRILALSQEQKEMIETLYDIPHRRIDLVGGGYDQQLFSLHKKDPPEPVQILYGGKLSFAKGVDWLLHTFFNLQERGLHLHLAGSGSGKEAETCLAMAKKAKTAITVHGRISQTELAKLMAKCHLFILPSFFEGLPLVLLEALASGCRIITTDLPGCRELLANASGDLAEMIELPAMTKIDRPNKEDRHMLEAKLATAIDRMVNRVRQAPSPSAREIQEITSSYSWEAVFRRIFTAYEKAVGERTG